MAPCPQVPQKPGARGAHFPPAEEPHLEEMQPCGHVGAPFRGSLHSPLKFFQFIDFLSLFKMTILVITNCYIINKILKFEKVLKL